MLFIVLLSLLLLLIIFLLVAQLTITLDSRGLFVEARWNGIATVRVFEHQDEWWIAFRTIFFSSRKRIFDRKRKKPAEGKKKPVKKGQRLRYHRIAQILRVLTSFRVRQCEIQVSTWDMATDAWLYAGMQMLPLKKYVQVNFNGQNYIFIQVRNRLYIMLLAFFNLNTHSIHIHKP